MSTTPINPHLLTEPQLMDWLGFKRRLDLENHLRKMKIPFAYGKGGKIITTVGAVDSALVGRPSTIQADAIDFE